MPLLSFWVQVLRVFAIQTCCGLPSLLDLTRLQDPKVSVPFYVEKLVISHGTKKETGWTQCNSSKNHFSYSQFRPPLAFALVTPLQLCWFGGVGCHRESVTVVNISVPHAAVGWFLWLFVSANLGEWSPCLWCSGILEWSWFIGLSSLFLIIMRVNDFALCSTLMWQPVFFAPKNTSQLLFTAGHRFPQWKFTVYFLERTRDGQMVPNCTLEQLGANIWPVARRWNVRCNRDWFWYFWVACFRRLHAQYPFTPPVSKYNLSLVTS